MPQLNDKAGPETSSRKRLLFIVNEGYFFLSHRMPVVRAAIAAGMDVQVLAPSDHVWAPEGFTLDDLEKQGLIVHSYRLSRRGKNILAEFLSFLTILKMIATIKPDVLHLLTIKPVIYGGIAARLCKTPSVVFAVTGLGQAFDRGGARQNILRKAVIMAYRFVTSHPNCKVIIQNSDNRAQLIKSRAVKEENLVLIKGSGVSMGEFTPSPEPPGPQLLILPARLIWEKGVREFVHAAAQLKLQGLDARFALVGDTQPSNPRAVPAEEIEKWVSEGAVEWWGRRTDMPAVIAQSSVVVLPSFYGEGVPKILIEAAASGRPIVTTDSAGCREIVMDRINGYLAKPKDVESLANAMKKLIMSAELRNSFGEAGRNLVEDQFSDTIVSKKTMDVYLGLIEKTGTHIK
jgi:glycosyltransferase involved in cell wall biosynthesis